MPDTEGPTSYNETIEREVHADCKQCGNQTGLAVVLALVLLASNVGWAVFSYNAIDRVSIKECIRTQTIVIRQTCNEKGVCSQQTIGY